MDARRDTRPGIEAMVEQMACAGCTDVAVLGGGEHDWMACTSPRGNRLTLSWDETRGALTLVRFLARRDASTIVGRFRMLNAAADTAATI